MRIHDVLRIGVLLTAAWALGACATTATQAQREMIRKQVRQSSAKQVKVLEASDDSLRPIVAGGPRAADRHQHAPPLRRAPLAYRPAGLSAPSGVALTGRPWAPALGRRPTRAGAGRRLPSAAITE